MPSPSRAQPLRPSTVPPRALDELVRALPGALVVTGSAAGVHVTGVTHDSHDVRPGDLYLARPGQQAHGADFVGQALAAGAVAVLTDTEGARRTGEVDVPVVVVPDPRAAMGRVAAWTYGEPARDLLLVGVTGTNGKTTTAYLLEAGLRAAGHRTGLIGTVETRVGDEVVASVRTTPEATDLHALFALMRERGVSAVAMEVSSHALALGRVAGTRYDVAVFTNLSQDHLDFHADMADYFAAKARLFTAEYADRGLANLDDAHGARIARESAVSVQTFSATGDPRADWRAVDVSSGSHGSTFRVLGPDGVDAAAATRLLAPFNVGNALAAIAGLVAAGVPLAAALDGVGEVAGVPGRLERVDAGQPFLALVDYAHTPEAVSALLAALRPVTDGRLVVVLGCGGDRDRGKRPLMGAAAVRGADLAVLTSDNPRSEDPLAILAAMRAGVDTVPAGERGEMVVEPDRRAAIARAVSGCASGDTVVVAGKGHEQGQEYADRVVAFDDRLVLREALLAAGSAA